MFRWKHLPIRFLKLRFIRSYVRDYYDPHQIIQPELLFMNKTNADILKLKKQIHNLEKARKILQEQISETATLVRRLSATFAAYNKETSQEKNSITDHITNMQRATSKNVTDESPSIDNSVSKASGGETTSNKVQQKLITSPSKEKAQSSPSEERFEQLPPKMWSPYLQPSDVQPSNELNIRMKPKEVHEMIFPGKSGDSTVSMNIPENVIAFPLQGNDVTPLQLTQNIEKIHSQLQDEYSKHALSDYESDAEHFTHIDYASDSDTLVKVQSSPVEQASVVNIAEEPMSESEATPKEEQNYKSESEGEAQTEELAQGTVEGAVKEQTNKVAKEDRREGNLKPRSLINENEMTKTSEKIPKAFKGGIIDITMVEGANSAATKELDTLNDKNDIIKLVESQEPQEEEQQSDEIREVQDESSAEVENFKQLQVQTVNAFKESKILPEDDVVSIDDSATEHEIETLHSNALEDPQFRNKRDEISTYSESTPAHETTPFNSPRDTNERSEYKTKSEPARVLGMFTEEIKNVEVYKNPENTTEFTNVQNAEDTSDTVADVPTYISSEVQTLKHHINTEKEVEYLTQQSEKKFKKLQQEHIQNEKQKLLYQRRNNKSNKKDSDNHPEPGEFVDY